METQSASKPGASPGMQVIHYTRRERYTILFFAFVGTIFDGADYSIFIQFIVPISKYFQTSFTSIMVIQSASYLTGIAGGILFGHLADRYGRRLGLSVTVALFSLGTLASALSPNYTWLLIFRIVTGLGIGGESGIAYAYLNEAWPSKRRGAVNSLMHCMFIVGSFISIVLYKVTVIRYGANAWQYAFAYLGAIAVLGALIRIFMPESKMWLALKEQGSKAALVRTSIKDLFAPELRRTTILMLFVITGGFFGSYSVITFGPSTWIGIYKIGPANFAIIGYWATLATMSAYFLSGSISDKVGRKRAYMTAALVGTAGYLFFGQ
jgi:SHS family lactate transporter-like MFS transporter